MVFDFSGIQNELNNINLSKCYGSISSISGYKISSIGPNVSIGDLCTIKGEHDDILCEVIGFKGCEKYLMPFKPLYNIQEGDKVYKEDIGLSVHISEDYLGCVLNGIGEVIQDNNIVNKRRDKISLFNSAPSPISRGVIDSKFSTGIKAIDGMLTIGVGQRVGVFAGSGVGKSTLLGNIIKNSVADVKVVCLVGERGRELNEFLNILGEDTNNCIVVTATSNESALLRLKSAYTATSIAEYFRDKGKNVLLVMDSLTRFAMAQRDIASNMGEIGVNKGYPPSVFNMLPELLERAGKNENGSITAIYTVLVEGDDDNEIISDTVRGILDGHIVLSRKLAVKKHFPAIDVLKSVSRLIDELIDDNHKQALKNMTSILAFYESKEEYLSMMYQRGTDANLDKIIDLKELINKFLVQLNGESFNFEASKQFMLDNFLNINVRL